MRIHYLSDLHLEFFKLPKVKEIIKKIIPKSPICVLAGDIGYPFQETYEYFLIEMNKKFEHVFLIHGNHEYYQLQENSGRNMYDIVNKTKDIINKNNLNNVPFLNDNYYDVGNYKFIGGVLWSKITNPEFAINDKYTIGNYSTENMNK